MRFRGDRAGPGPAWDDGAPDALVTELAALARSMDPAPSDPRVPATRASVLGAFAAAGARPGSALRADRPPARRPAFALLLAGALLVAVSVGAAASTPGLPLYGLRLAVEELVLPEAPELRDIAQLDRLDERIREAAAAAAVRDEGALRASLGEYARIAESIAARVGPDEAALSRVRRQLAVLDGLASSDPLGEAERIRARTAALALIRALGGTDDAAPSPPATPVPSSGPGAGGMPSPGAPGTSSRPGPGDPGGPRASSGPGGSGGPSGPGGSGGPSATSGPRSSGGPGAGGTGSDASSDPGRGQPSPGSGPGSAGSGGDGPDPAPTGGSGPGNPGSGAGSGGTAPAPSSDPGSGLGSGDPGDGGGSDGTRASGPGGEQGSTGG